MTAAIRVTERMLKAHARLVLRGLTDKGAAAVVGNFVQESFEDLDSTMYRAHPDASGGIADALKSGGIAEWLGDRKLACIAFSQAAEKAQGLKAGSLLDDLETQCDFVVHELTTVPEYRALYNQITTDTGRSVDTLTMNVMMIYERPKIGPTDGRTNRMAHADALYARIQAIRAAAAPVPQPVPTLPVSPDVALGPLVPAPAPTTPTAETAGRNTAILDTLYKSRQACEGDIAKHEAEITAIKKSMDAIDHAVAEFSGLLPQAEFKPPDTLPPAQLSVTQDKGIHMPSFITGILTNWITSLTGTAVGVPAILDVVGGHPDWNKDLPLLLTMVMGLFAKDHTTPPSVPTK